MQSVKLLLFTFLILTSYLEGRYDEAQNTNLAEGYQQMMKLLKSSFNYWLPNPNPISWTLKVACIM